MSSRTTHKRRLKVRIMAIEYLGGKCIKCGHTGSAATFEFHHRDPSKKKFQISSGNTHSWEKVKKEISKCDLLCSNCHRNTHYTSHDLEKEIREHLYDTPKEKVCTVCSTPVSKHGSRCLVCFRRSREKIAWPGVSILKTMVKKHSYIHVGRQLGVSDVAVKKRIRNHSRVP